MTNRFTRSNRGFNPSDFTKPDLRIAGSDGLDFYAISKFDKDPKRLKANGLQDEIDLWRKGQAEWRSAHPEARVYFLRSNHDDRLQKYLMRHRELYDLRVLQLPVLLGLDALGIEWEHQKGELANYELVVENEAYTTILDVLLRMQKEQDSSLAFRYACRVNMCGSCGMVINGRERLACKTNVSDIPKDRTITLRPLNHFPIVKDLVVDMTPFFQK